MRLHGYQTEGFHDEMFDGGGGPRPEARLLLDTIQSLEEGQFLRCQHSAERLLLQMGITFNVYGDSAGTERIFPFDLIPRIVRAEEWDWIERGLRQRIHALNEFIDDIYHDQKILKDKIIPDITGFGLEICNLPKGEALHNHIAQDLEPMVDRFSSGSGGKCRFGCGWARCTRVDCQWATFYGLGLSSFIRHMPTF